MKAERTIYLIRHGHIGMDGDPKKYIAMTDMPLSDTGIKQAQALGAWLEGRPVKGVYCSALLRSMGTADAIAARQGGKPVIVPALHEVNMGAWEGKTFAEIRAGYPDEYAERGRSIADFRPPCGESFADCQRRVWAAFMGILQATAGDVAIVAHAGVNRVLLCRMLGMDLDGIFCVGQDYGCVNSIGYAKDAFTIQLLNFVPGRDCRHGIRAGHANG